jgi:cytochrome c oxidase subunit 2
LTAAPPRRPARRWLAAAAGSATAIAVLIVASPAGASIISPRTAHSPNAEDLRTAYWIALIAAAVLGIAAVAALLVAVGRFRERRGASPARLVAGRGFFLRAGVPLGAVAIGLFVAGIILTDDAQQVEAGSSASSASAAQTAQVGVHGVPSQALQQAIETLRNTTPTNGPIGGAVKGGPIEIGVVGQQWLWRFFYPGGPTASGAYSPSGGRPGDRTFSYATLVVPVDTPIILNITSSDVMHRWFVPALGGQVDAVPGHVSQTWFKADRTGVFPGQSTAFSGTGYSTMRIYVRVVSQAAYEAWLKRQATDLRDAQDSVNKVVEADRVPGEGAP